MPSIIEIVMMIAIVAAAIFGYLNHSILSAAVSAPAPVTTTATA